MISSVHIWGDSIAKGVVFDEARGRYAITPGRAVAQLAGLLDAPLVSHARMGATAPEGLADFRGFAGAPGAVVAIEYGGNDCDMPWQAVSEQPDGAHPARVPLDAFAQALTDFVRGARAACMRPLLVLPPPIDAQRYFDWVTRALSQAAVLRFLGDVQHIYRWHERYAGAVRRVAAAEGCPLLDLREPFLQARDFARMLCCDGIHPNERGQALIAAAVLDARPALRRALEAG